MADKKISALTAATTPLAGTEVLPIVQSGSTVKVSVDNLTTGKNVTAAAIYTTGDSGFGTSTPSYRVHAVKDVNGSATVGVANSTAGTSALARFIAISDAGNAVFGMTSTTYADITGASDSALINANGASGGLVIAFDGVKKASISPTGNFVPIAAQGVNFTANTPAAGMTSQLLNWYEEGSYTATLTSVGGGSITVSTSFDTLGYTRIGRMVYVHGYITASSVSTPTGELRLNVPFNTCATTQVGERGSWGSGGINISGSASSVANGFQISWSDNKSYVTISLVTGNVNADAAAQILGGSNTDIRVGFWYPCLA